MSSTDPTGIDAAGRAGPSVLRIRLDRGPGRGYGRSTRTGASRASCSGCPGVRARPIPSTPSPATPIAAPSSRSRRAVPGMLLGPHLPKLARQAKDLAIVRSMSSQGRGPWPGDLLPSHRLSAPGSDPLPDARLAWWPTSLTTIRPSSGVRQHLARSRDQSGRIHLGLSRPEVRPAERRRAEPGGGRGRHRAFLVAGRRSRHPARHRPDPGRRAARPDANLWKWTSSQDRPGVPTPATRVPTAAQ